MDFWPMQNVDLGLYFQMESLVSLKIKLKNKNGQKNKIFKTNIWEGHLAHVDNPLLKGGLARF